LKSNKVRIGIAFLVFHSVVLLLFTGGVLIALRWNESLKIGDNEVLLNAKDGKPIRINPYLETSPAHSLASSQVSANARLDSVMVSLPSSTGEKDQILRRYQVEATEIRHTTNTTLLWLTLNHLLTITPDEVVLSDLDNDEIINVWEISKDETPNFEEKNNLIKNSIENENLDFIAKSEKQEGKNPNRRLYGGYPTPMPYVAYYPYTYSYASYAKNGYFSYSKSKHHRRW